MSTISGVPCDHSGTVCTGCNRSLSDLLAEATSNEEQVRAEERGRCLRRLKEDLQRYTPGGNVWCALTDAIAFVGALGPAPVDCQYGDCSKPSAAPWMHQPGCPASAGPAPIDDTAARLTPAQQAEEARIVDEIRRDVHPGALQAERRQLEERLAAAEGRVWVLEGALREVVAIVGPSDASMMKRLQTICRSALAKKSEGT